MFRLSLLVLLLSVCLIYAASLPGQNDDNSWPWPCKLKRGKPCVAPYSLCRVINNGFFMCCKADVPGTPHCN
ncbi:hypothetical protein L596_023211 [Steinernema carpocapsae]|uniref:WAP domain-containing protein n=1 Tax=Steinernema carpocapsae TaxID=34508 RepID=A0A4U5MD08_STECR|nr:hypothetical protein L596_023211 [Steinernema carpocapsae]